MNEAGETVTRLMIPPERWQRRSFPGVCLAVVAGSLLSVAGLNVLMIASATLPLPSLLQEWVYERIPDFVARMVWIFVAVVLGRAAVALTDSKAGTDGHKRTI